MPTKRKVGEDEMQRVNSYQDNGNYAKYYEQGKAELAKAMREDQNVKYPYMSKSQQQGLEAQNISANVPRSRVGNFPFGR